MTEAEEQTMLFQWAEYQRLKYPQLALMFHVPNGGSRNLIEAKKFKQMGVKPGVPDIFLPVARGGFHGLFIEMKRSDGGRLSDSQANYIQKLRMQGYQAVICKGFEPAVSVIKAYLEGEE